MGEGWHLNNLVTHLFVAKFAHFLRNEPIKLPKGRRGVMTSKLPPPSSLGYATDPVYQVDTLLVIALISKNGMQLSFGSSRYWKCQNAQMKETETKSEDTQSQKAFSGGLPWAITQPHLSTFGSAASRRNRSTVDSPTIHSKLVEYCGCVAILR